MAEKKKTTRRKRAAKKDESPEAPKVEQAEREPTTAERLAAWARKQAKLVYENKQRIEAHDAKARSRGYEAEAHAKRARQTPRGHR